jgi:hypothetical protein
MVLWMPIAEVMAGLAAALAGSPLPLGNAEEVR